MAAILRGLNRAYPYVAGDKLKFLDEEIGTLYKLTHLVGFNIATQAIQLLHSLYSEKELPDR